MAYSRIWASVASNGGLGLFQLRGPIPYAIILKTISKKNIIVSNRSKTKKAVCGFSSCGFSTAKMTQFTPMRKKMRFLNHFFSQIRISSMRTGCSQSIPKEVPINLLQRSFSARSSSGNPSGDSRVRDDIRLSSVISIPVERAWLRSRNELDVAFIFS